jgi:hypothetical protein
VAVCFEALHIIEAVPAAFRLFILGTVALLAVESRARAEGAMKVNAQLPLILGEVEEVQLTFEVKETPETDGRPLQVSVNVGQIEALERVARGNYTAKYRLPSSKSPEVAIFAFWFETGPDADVDFARLPLHSRTKLPYKAKPGSEVKVEVGNEVFGPGIADRKGSATVPIVVPPGIRDVVVIIGDQRTTFPVKVPRYNRLALAVVPYMVAPDGASPATVHAFYDAEVPPPVSALKLTVPPGELKPIEGGAHYRLRYTPAAKLQEKEAIISAAIELDPDATSGVRLLIGSPTPSKILIVQGDKRPGSGTNTDFDITVLDDRGLGVPGQKIEPRPSVGTIDKVDDLGHGHYRATLIAPSELPYEGRVDVEARIEQPSGPIVARIDTIIHEAPPLEGGAVQHGITRLGGPPVLFMGARIGGGFEGSFSPFGGIELSLRPRFLEQRLGFQVGAGYRIVSQKFSVRALMANVTSSLVRIPITAGASYDFVQDEDWRIYGAGAAGVAFLSHSIEADFQASQSLHHISPTVELGGGIAFNGIFVELAASFMPLSGTELSGSPISVIASLGYRLGIL